MSVLGKMPRILGRGSNRCPRGERDVVTPRGSQQDIGARVVRRGVGGTDWRRIETEVATAITA
jgi:hypothetical protein